MDGKIVSMIEHKGELYIATTDKIYIKDEEGFTPVEIVEKPTSVPQYTTTPFKEDWHWSDPVTCRESEFNKDLFTTSPFVTTC